jgi:hypothetical protein
MRPDGRKADLRRTIEMTEKDPFHDKLRDKGKASEDLYIEQEERRRLERLRAAAVAGASGACPRDGTKLVTRMNGGLQIEMCLTCRGVWLDASEVEMVLKSQNEAALIHWVRSLFEH